MVETALHVCSTGSHLFCITGVHVILNLSQSCASWILYTFHITFHFRHFLDISKKGVCQLMVFFFFFFFGELINLLSIRLLCVKKQAVSNTLDDVEAFKMVLVNQYGFLGPHSTIFVKLPSTHLFNMTSYTLVFIFDKFSQLVGLLNFSYERDQEYLLNQDLPTFLFGYYDTITFCSSIFYLGCVEDIPMSKYCL